MSARPMRSPFGTFKFDIRLDGGIIRFEYTLKLLSHRIDLESYKLFADFCRQVDTIRSGAIRLGKTP